MHFPHKILLSAAEKPQYVKEEVNEVQIQCQSANYGYAAACHASLCHTPDFLGIISCQPDKDQDAKDGQTEVQCRAFKEDVDH